MSSSAIFLACFSTRLRAFPMPHSVVMFDLRAGPRFLEVAFGQPQIPDRHLYHPTPLPNATRTQKTHDLHNFNRQPFALQHRSRTVCRLTVVERDSHHSPLGPCHVHHLSASAIPL